MASQARRQRRKSDKHFAAFGKILMSFYNFLESEPQPADEQVRQKFIDKNNQWLSYCKRWALGSDAQDMFVHEVREAWHKRYSKPVENISKT